MARSILAERLGSAGGHLLGRHAQDSEGWLLDPMYEWIDRIVAKVRVKIKHPFGLLALGNLEKSRRHE